MASLTLFLIAIGSSFMLACITTATIPADFHTEKALQLYLELTEIHQNGDVVQGYVGEEKLTLHVTGTKVVVLDKRPIRSANTDSAEVGQLMDVATTTVGIAAFGAVEVNPLDWGILPVKYVMNEAAEDMGGNDCRNMKRGLSSFGWGASAANTATIAVGAFSVASLGVGALVGSIAYNYLDGSSGCGWLGPPVALDHIDPLEINKENRWAIHDFDDSGN